MQQAIQAQSEFNVLFDRHLSALVEFLMKCAHRQYRYLSKFQIPSLLLNFQAAQKLSHCFCSDRVLILSKLLRSNILELHFA